jgi:hypothetical protein
MTDVFPWGPLLTPLGAKISGHALPDHLTERIGGPGMMLHLDMEDPADLRHAEVVLSLANIQALAAALRGITVLLEHPRG